MKLQLASTAATLLMSTTTLAAVVHIEDTNMVDHLHGMRCCIARAPRLGTD